MNVVCFFLESLKLTALTNIISTFSGISHLQTHLATMTTSATPLVAPAKLISTIFRTLGLESREESSFLSTKRRAKIP